MKIATWNVNGIRASFDKGLLDFAQKSAPDLLCLQETKAHPDQLTERQRGFYPQAFWSICGAKKGYSGTAIFSKKPPLSVSKGMGIKKFDHEGRMVIFEEKAFVLLNIYFPNGAMTSERHFFKQEFLKRLPPFLTELKRRFQKEIIVLGDYNTAYQDIDVYDPERLKASSGFLPEERQWFCDFLKEGFVDVYRCFYPKKSSAYTWWSFREGARPKNRGWRIDHICVTKGLLPRIQSIEIISSQQGSDHCPVVMVLDA